MNKPIKNIKNIEKELQPCNITMKQSNARPGLTIQFPYEGYNTTRRTPPPPPQQRTCKQNNERTKVSYSNYYYKSYTPYSNYHQQNMKRPTPVKCPNCAKPNCTTARCRAPRRGYPSTNSLEYPPAPPTVLLERDSMTDPSTYINPIKREKQNKKKAQSLYQYVPAEDDEEKEIQRRPLPPRPSSTSSRKTVTIDPNQQQKNQQSKSTSKSYSKSPSTQPPKQPPKLPTKQKMRQPPFVHPPFQQASMTKSPSIITNLLTPQLYKIPKIVSHIKKDEKVQTKQAPKTISSDVQDRIKEALEKQRREVLELEKVTTGTENTNVYFITVPVAKSEVTTSSTWCWDRIKFTFAVKHFKLSNSSVSQKNAFQRELAAMHQMLVSPYCVSLLGHFTLASEHYLIYEYMDCGSLRRLLSFSPNGISCVVLQQLTYQLMKGLSFLQESQIIHRDLKPENVLLKGSGSLKISDFGLSKCIANFPDAKTFLGTEKYMSPERSYGRKHSYSADMWSVGVMLYELYVGVYPLDADDMNRCSLELLDGHGACSIAFSPRKSNFVDRVSSMDPNLKDFITSCVAINPDERISASQALSHPFLTKKYHEAHKPSSRSAIRQFISEHSLVKSNSQ